MHGKEDDKEKEIKKQVEVWSHREGALKARLRKWVQLKGPLRSQQSVTEGNKLGGGEGHSRVIISGKVSECV